MSCKKSLGDMVYMGRGVKFDKELLDLIVARVNKEEEGFLADGLEFHQSICQPCAF